MNAINELRTAQGNTAIPPLVAILFGVAYAVVVFLADLAWPRTVIGGSPYLAMAFT